MDAEGSNRFYLPHTDIRKRQNKGVVLTDLVVTAALIYKAKLAIVKLQANGV